jgi:hypothetical protein
METFTKKGLISQLEMIKERGWIPNSRKGNDGGIGNTLEDLLGIPENNLPIPNAAEWELKTQRSKTTALNTLFHMEPSPRALRIVPNTLLPHYGWQHQKAGVKHPINEMSFRQTINTKQRTDRGFGVVVNRVEKKLEISFDPNYVNLRHTDWLNSVEQRIGLQELNPTPYWGFNDLFHKAGTKLQNCFFVKADVKKDSVTKQLFFHYNKLMILSNFDLERFIDAIENGGLLVEFDARTGHNHGTKFRIRQNILPELYKHVEEIF